MEPAEFILKIVIIATLCFGIIGMIVMTTQFEGIVRGQDNERLTIDLAHAVSAAPCLTEKMNGESRKGLLLESELDKYGGSEACITLGKPWSVSVTDGTKTWNLGGELSGTVHSKTLPVAVKRADGTVVPGKLTAKLEVFG
jgi:hypothetical protein